MSEEAPFRLDFDWLPLHVEAVPGFGTDRHGDSLGRFRARQDPALCDVVRLEPRGFRVGRQGAPGAALVAPAPEHEPLRTDRLRGDCLHGVRAAGIPGELRRSRDALPVDEDQQPRGVRRDRSGCRNRSVQPGNPVNVSRRQSFRSDGNPRGDGSDLTVVHDRGVVVRPSPQAVGEECEPDVPIGKRFGYGDVLVSIVPLVFVHQTDGVADLMNRVA